ncbi:MAG: hypothetical protein IJ769_02395 [Clostridia bacterium]|nr:hypothetical protein [Clostridia bacterium]
MSYELPQALEVSGRDWAIRADYREILKILAAFDDPDLTDAEKAYVCLHNLYANFEDMPEADYPEAFQAAAAFIDHGAGGSGAGPRTVDWERDAPLLFPAVNRVAGYEVRGAAFLHWWTFLGMFMEIRDSVYATVLALRQKRARGEKLEKWERDFWHRNAGICQLKPRLTELEQAEKARLTELLGGVRSL